jgi:hypothetical protein
MDFFADSKIEEADICEAGSQLSLVDQAPKR